MAPLPGFAAKVFFLEPTEVSLTGLTYDDYGVWDSASADFAPIPDPGFQTPLHALLEALAQYMVDDGAAADLEEARPYAGSMLDVSNGGYGVYLNSVNGSSHPTDGYYYTYMVGNVPGSEGIGAYELQEGDSVTLVVSKGEQPKPVTVLSFIGIDIEIVRQQVTQTGLVVGEVTQRASDEPYGTVIDQSISAETQVDAGTTINFVISEGPAMPDYGDDATTSGGEPQP